ncbi:hypothetical protein WN943_017094 [Citrus x changshan-huyou]
MPSTKTLIILDDEGEPQKTGVRKGGETRAEVAIRFGEWWRRESHDSCCTAGSEGIGYGGDHTTGGEKEIRGESTLYMQDLRIEKWVVKRALGCLQLPQASLSMATARPVSTVL